MPARAFITGLSGFSITKAERSFLRDAAPWGLILFKRNIENKKQVAELVNSYRDIIGRKDAPILVDQEGGRVQRLGPPHWPSYPPGKAYGDIYDHDPEAGVAAARLGARLIAADLEPLGISVDCLPVADVPVAAADPVIGDRAYGATVPKVAALAAAAAEGLMNGGVLPVLKHIPGHGRANTDSHAGLPVVRADRRTLEATDFAAFRALSGLPLAMTAHVVFTAFDPVLPATTSSTMIQNVIRGFIGFDGLLMSDDVSMGALSGTIGERTTAALAAGCDVVLHCNGKLDEMEEVARHAPLLAGDAERRAAQALNSRRPPRPIDLAAARAEFAALMRGSATTQMASR
jgi:beta-N-acetylhexosaminidase